MNGFTNDGSHWQTYVRLVRRAYVLKDLIRQMTSEEYEEEKRVLLLEARTAIRRAEFLHMLLSDLLRDWPMVKRVIDLEI